MTSDFGFGLASALWLGILTSISPCPLATNIAAVSFIGRRVGSPRSALAAGASYALGRVATYVLLAALLVTSLLRTPTVSGLLQKYANKALGPLLILVGMVLLDLFALPSFGEGVRERLQRKAEGTGALGALVLGVAFALSFCPVSAALFFGSLVPLAAAHGSFVAMPALYGLGTGLPVLGFAFLLVFGANRLGRAFDRVATFEWWARRVTGVVFVGVGIYYSLVFIFGVLA